MSIDLKSLTALDFFNLPYAYDALEPYIDAKTMELHHEGHHAAYVNNLQKALTAYPGLEREPLLPLLNNLAKVAEPVCAAVINNGGGHLNHTFFWDIMTPKSSGTPRGASALAITKTFGSFDAFKSVFNAKALSVFGSGWAWLVINQAGNLEVLSTPNQEPPSLKGLEPILGLDVWEHAYYLKYTNKRASYIEAWWHIVNWDKVEDLYRQRT